MLQILITPMVLLQYWLSGGDTTSKTCQCHLAATARQVAPIHRMGRRVDALKSAPCVRPSFGYLLCLALHPINLKSISRDCQNGYNALKVSSEYFERNMRRIVRRRDENKEIAATRRQTWGELGRQEQGFRVSRLGRLADRREI